MTMYAFSRCSFLRNTAGMKNVNVCNTPPNIIRFMTASLKSENEKNPAVLRAKIKAGLAESTLSKSMKAYLKRAMDHEALMKREIAQYTIGKRHLANMMGKDPETFTQKDINAAIKYLFPSGLFDPKARPSMQHPNDTYPAQKEAQFDTTGRPFHFLFYTVQSNYYESLYDIAEEIEILNSKEESIIRTTGEPVTESKFNLIGSDWLSYEDVCDLLRETLEQEQYKYLILSLQRLADHPLSSEASTLINKFRKKLRAIVDLESNLPIQTDENGRPYVVVEPAITCGAFSLIFITIIYYRIYWFSIKDLIMKAKFVT